MNKLLMERCHPRRWRYIRWAARRSNLSSSFLFSSPAFSYLLAFLFFLSLFLRLFYLSALKSWGVMFWANWN